MATSVVSWWRIVGVGAAIAAAALLFFVGWGAPIVSATLAGAAGYLIAGHRIGWASTAALASQLIVAITYVNELPGSYPWIWQRGGRIQANLTAWAVWLLICLAIASLGYAWRQGRRAMIARVVGAGLVVFGVFAGGLYLAGIGAACSFYGSSCDELGWVYLVVVSVAAIPIVGGLVLIGLARRFDRPRSDDLENGQLSEYST